MEHFPALEDPAWVLATSVALLSGELPPALQEKARSLIRKQLTRLVEASPRVMEPRLLLLWAEAPEWAAFSEQELTALEAIAALPAWSDISLFQMFLEARARLKEAGIPHPGIGAFEVALWSNTDWPAYMLLRRAESTRSLLLPGARHRLGRILWKIGSRVSQQPTHLERMLGLQLMAAGAMDMEDDAERERAEHAQKEAIALFHAADQADLERWPLPSLWEEVAEARARDEQGHFREFAGTP